MSTCFVHEQALCESADIGAGTRVWAFTHILAGAVIGRDCNICDQVFIENDVVIGNRVTIKSGVQLWDGIRLEDEVFIGPNATFTNDPFPRSKATPDCFLETVIQQGATIGANATILPGLTIGYSAMVGAGAVVTKNVPPHAIVLGNPARIVGYLSDDADANHEVLSANRGAESNNLIESADRQSIGVGACALWSLPSYDDMRGFLTVTEFSQDLPFNPQRCFFVYEVPGKNVRGEHAHRICEQFLVAVHGELSVVVDDGNQRKEVRLDKPSAGLFMPAGTWGIQYKFSSDAVLAVFASHPYSSEDYIREYSEFLRFVEQKD